ncbi:hypothetical protein CHS0354_009174 [Potamilus streckersoni]|uniref:Uncharacterized protein n=1 Tax=Potamilus streckersoni TaxID=2493646 RepID=A0AAE0RZC7_9BIVA|nr:hypothetical protein CHS0354_009174 [Potamilus streckersoni]
MQQASTNLNAIHIWNHQQYLRLEMRVTWANPMQKAATVSKMLNAWENIADFFEPTLAQLVKPTKKSQQQKQNRNGPQSYLSSCNGNSRCIKFEKSTRDKTCSNSKTQDKNIKYLYPQNPTKLKQTRKRIK